MGDSVPVRPAPSGDPSGALRFHREWVSQNRPVLFRGAARHWRAVDKWADDRYLRSAIGSAPVTVAVTPTGYADAIHEDGEEGDLVFVTPAEEVMTFNQFLDRLDSPLKEEVPYVQKQVRGIMTAREKGRDGWIGPDCKLRT